MIAKEKIHKPSKFGNFSDGDGSGPQLTILANGWEFRL